MADGYNAWSAEDAQFVLRQAAADAGSAAQSAANDAQSRQDPLRSPPTSIAATRGPIYSQIFVDADIGMTGMSRRIVVNDLSWS